MLLLLTTALCGVPIALPAGQDAAVWKDALELAGLESRTGARLHVVVREAAWLIRAPASDGSMRSLAFPPPITQEDREAFAFLARGLAREVRLERDLASLSPMPAPTPAPPPPPPPPLEVLAPPEPLPPEPAPPEPEPAPPEPEPAPPEPDPPAEAPAPAAVVAPVASDVPPEPPAAPEEPELPVEPAQPVDTGPAVPEPAPVEPAPVDPPVEPAPTVPEEPPPLEPEPVAVAPEPTPEPASVRPPREPRSEPRPPREPRPARPSRAPVTGVAPVTLAIGPSARPGMNASAWVGVGFRPVDTGVATLDLELGWVPERWIPVPQSIQFRTMDTADLEVRLGLRPLPMGLVYAGGAVSHRTFHQQGQRIATRVRPLVVTGVEVDPMRSWRIAPVLRVGVGYDLVPTMVVSETGHSRTLTSFQLVSTLGVRVTPTTLFGKTEKRARL